MERLDLSPEAEFGTAIGLSGPFARCETLELSDTLVFVHLPDLNSSPHGQFQEMAVEGPGQSVPSPAVTGLRRHLECHK